jgi:hypothetical protein
MHLFCGCFESVCLSVCLSVARMEVYAPVHVSCPGTARMDVCVLICTYGCWFVAVRQHRERPWLRSCDSCGQGTRLRSGYSLWYACNVSRGCELGTGVPLWHTPLPPPLMPAYQVGI